MKRSIRQSQLIQEKDATATIQQFKDHTDPKYIGPGTWDTIHRLAFKAHTKKSQLGFIESMKEICYGFGCKVCRGHCSEYIKNHPMEEYIGMQVDVDGQDIELGMFVWTWKFHNAVNARLKKPIMSWLTAYNLYSESDSLVCSKSCLESE